MDNHEHQQKIEQHRGQPGNAGQFGTWPASESQAQLPSDADVMRGATGVQDGVNPLAGTGSLAYPPPIETTADAIHFGSTVAIDDAVCSKVVAHDDQVHRDARLKIRKKILDTKIHTEAKQRFENTKKPWYRDEKEHWQKILQQTKEEIGPAQQRDVMRLRDDQMHLRPEVHRGNVQAVIRSYAMVANAPKIKESGQIRFEDPEMLANTRLMCDGHKQSVADIYDTYVDGRDDLTQIIGMPKQDTNDLLDRMNHKLMIIVNNTDDIRESARRTEQYAAINAENSEEILHETKRQSWVMAAGVNAQLAAHREMRVLRHYADATEQRRVEAQKRLGR